MISQRFRAKSRGKILWLQPLQQRENPLLVFNSVQAYSNSNELMRVIKNADML